MKKIKVIIGLSFLSLTISCSSDDDCRCRDFTTESGSEFTAFTCGDEFEFRTNQDFIEATERCM